MKSEVNHQVACRTESRVSLPSERACSESERTKRGSVGASYQGPETSQFDPESPDCARLIELTLELRTKIGDGLNDDEFTQLLQQSVPCHAEGFRVACYSDGCLTLKVPEQDLGQWYTDEGWIHPAKETLARSIAAKYELTLCEPPDKVSYIVPPRGAHHHLELIARWENIVAAHPFYLKVRLMASRDTHGKAWTHQYSIPSAPDLVRDLTALYK